MTKRITIDPITRIEGHLRIDVEIDDGAVANSWASCTMWRGIERILQGRDPREAWLFTQRFCGVCTTVHAMASVRAVEDSLKLEIPANAQYIRNLILINHGLHDHIVHFYQLSALDWVDVLQVPKADPAKTASLAETERKALSQRAEAAEKQLKELKDELSFRDYSTSDEFKSKFQAPYEAAWQRAMSDLKELTVDEGGQPRPITADDMVQLVNLPLPQAREQAEAMFGPFANDVMAHRKEIKNLFEAQQSALKDARKTGAERAKQMSEQAQKQFEGIKSTIDQTWQTANESVVKDPEIGKYFTPVEGDEEWNNRLKKGFELVDKAMSINPANPKLTPEERASAVKRHAAMRNRAAAFGPMRYHLEKANARIAELETELAKYAESVPKTTGQSAEPAGEAAGSTRSVVFGALRKLAK